ncbi:MAG: pyruvate, water dikinase regulatory protein [Rhodothalassiaceae bacterium]
MSTAVFHLHLVSDATGETLEAIATAAAVQFDQVRLHKHLWPLVRTAAHMARIMDDIERRPGLVLYTLVNEGIREVLVTRCDKAGLPHLSVLDPVIGALGRFLGRQATQQPGRQHAMDNRYFRRIEAMDFTMAHDDGLIPEDLHQADIILVGVSRTSKTPTAIYLANRGYKVANVPFVPGRDMPAVLDGPLDALVVGLTTTPERLMQVRGNRLRQLNHTGRSDYVDHEHVVEEIRACRKFCNARRWPVIDVSRRSIEETAAAILKLYEEFTEAAENDL